MTATPSRSAPSAAPAGSIGRITVALRVVGDAVDPAVLTARLGVAPTFAARKGEEIWSRGQSLIQRHGVWSYALTEQAELGEELDDAIMRLLARLPAEPALWAELAARHEVGVFCGLFLTTENQGTELQPATLAALAARRLTLSLDIYGR